MDFSNFKIPPRTSRVELIHALFTVPGCTWRTQGEHTAYVFAPSSLLYLEARQTINTAAAIKGFGVKVGEYDGQGFIVDIDAR